MILPLDVYDLYFINSLVLCYLAKSRGDYVDGILKKVILRGQRKFVLNTVLIGEHWTDFTTWRLWTRLD